MLVPPAPRDTAVITGHRPRTPERIIVDVPDPVSGRPIPLAVWHYLAPKAAHPPSASPVVMVHGFRGDHHGLALLADCLPDAEIFLPELPGFGHSPAFPDAEHTVAHYASAVGHAVQALGLVPISAGGHRAAAQQQGTAPQPLLLGHSFGSVVASRLASETADYWNGLVLINPICEPALAADGSPVERALARLAQGYYAVSATLPESVGMALLSSPVIVWFTGTVMAKTEDRNTLAYLHDQHQSHFSAFDHRQVLVEAYRSSITGTVLDVADKLDLPVLLIAGAQDELGSVAGQEHLATRISTVSTSVRLDMLEGVGHLIHYERAPQAAAIIRDFRRDLHV